MQIVLVNFAEAIVYTDDGGALPITNFFDEFGDPVDDWRDATTFVAGAGQNWYGGKLADWTRATVN